MSSSHGSESVEGWRMESCKSGGSFMQEGEGGRAEGVNLGVKL